MSRILMMARPYACPVCGKEALITTNHIGETYSGCKNCHGSIMFCMGPQAVQERESRPFIEADIVHYRYHFDNPGDKAAYDELCLELSSIYTLHDVLGDYRYLQALRSHTTAKLYTDKKSLFGDQWVASVGRLHNWYEHYVDDRRSKAGYYLRKTEAMMTAVAGISYCHFCGVRSTKLTCGHDLKYQYSLTLKGL